VPRGLELRKRNSGAIESENGSLGLLSLCGPPV